MKRRSFTQRHLTATLVLGALLFVSIFISAKLPIPTQPTPLSSPLLNDCGPLESPTYNSIKGSNGVLLPTTTWAVDASVATVSMPNSEDVPFEVSPTDTPYVQELEHSANAILTAQATQPPIATLTPLSDRGTRWTNLSKITILSADVEHERLFYPATYLDRLVAVAKTKAGETFVVLIDLATGQSQRLSNVSDEGIYQPRISNRFVAWTTSAKDTGKSELRLFDLEQRCIGKANTTVQVRNDFDLRDNLLAWSHAENGSWKISAYNLVSKELFAVTSGQSLNGYPRICSAEWLTYLDNIGSDSNSSGYGFADLFAYNLKTKEKLDIGQVPYPLTVSAGKQFVCDGNFVAWIGGGNLTGYTRLPLTQNLYNLTTKTNRRLDIEVPYLPSLQLNDGILRGSEFFDLVRDVPFSGRFDFPSEVRTSGAYSLLTKGKYVFLTPGDGDIPPAIYTASLERD